MVGGQRSEVITGLYSNFVLYWSSTVVLRTTVYRTVPYCTVLYPPLPSSTLPQEPRSTLDRESSTLVAVPAPPCSSEKQATIHYPPGRARPPRPKNNLDNDSTKPPVAQPTTKAFETFALAALGRSLACRCSSRLLLLLHYRQVINTRAYKREGNGEQAKPRVWNCFQRQFRAGEWRRWQQSEPV